MTRKPFAACPSECAARGLRYARRFTLIELLVVIAIIAILAAMLLPVLSRAKSVAIRVTCTSNQHQVYLGLSMYANDEDGFIPPAGIADLPNRIYWTTDNFWAEPVTADLRGMRDYWTPDIAVCPGFARGANYGDSAWRNYWMNWTMPGFDWDTIPHWDRNWLGYYYLQGDHIIWEIRYGIYRGMHALKMGRDYPCGHQPRGSFNGRVLAHCLAYNGSQITPYWQPLAAVLGEPWISFPHDPGRPSGVNATFGDGATIWLGIEHMRYQYNGWTTLNLAFDFTP